MPEALESHSISARRSIIAIHAISPNTETIESLLKMSSIIFESCNERISVRTQLRDYSHNQFIPVIFSGNVITREYISNWVSEVNLLIHEKGQ